MIFTMYLHHKGLPMLRAWIGFNPALIGTGTSIEKKSRCRRQSYTIQQHIICQSIFKNKYYTFIACWWGKYDNFIHPRVSYSL